jgi:hypothetical protein
MRYALIGWVLAALALGLLAGCRVQEPSPVPDSPLATPGGTTFTSPLAGPKILPTPSSSDKGTIGGVLIRDVTGQAVQPYVGAVLYIAPLVNNSEGAPMLAGLDKSTAPKAQTNDQGFFAFTDVAPGTYALIFDTPLSSFILHRPGSGDALLVEVKGGDVHDLGELRYDLAMP